jgi:predicted phage terminase large subunit-like protein
MRLSPTDEADLRSDLLAFTRYMFKARRGVDLKPAPHHSIICNALERVVAGYCPRLIINVPPRSGKTELAVKNFIAWCMANFPDAEFIHASYSKRLATTNTWETRAIMQHEAFAAAFGAATFRDDSNAKDEFRTSQGGIVYATGAEGTITGYGAGKMRDYFGGAIVIDDPHKAGEGNSDLMRQNVIDWFQTTMESRANNKPHTPIIVIMQRLHEMDLSGWLMAGKNGEVWEQITIPAIDPAGDSFWPEQFPISELRRMEAANAYVFAGQYMQRPAPLGGGIFKDEWWQYWRTMPPPLEYRTIYGDTALKTKEQNDWSVFQCWGKSRGGQAVMLDQIRGKWEAPELLVNARAFWAKHKAATSLTPLRAFKVEDKASGTGLIQTLKREGVPIIGIPRGIDKVTRAMDVAPLVQSGNVILPGDAEYLSAFLAEASGFPNAAHDDMLDPMMDAVSDMLQAPSGGGFFVL